MNKLLKDSEQEVEIIKIFDYEIIKCKIPKYLYEKKILKEDIESTFNSELVLTKGNNTIEQVGEAYSTGFLGNESVTNLKEISPLVNYISTIILKYFYGDKLLNKKKIFYLRMWMNKMLKNCAIKCHIHLSNELEGMPIEGVSIFYYNVPPGGSDLIILKDNIGSEVTEKHKDICKYIKVETGDLILHKPNVPHAISKHLGDEPRISFIFDFCSKDNLEYVYS